MFQGLARMSGETDGYGVYGVGRETNVLSCASRTSA
jgi:hypothetical protein